MKIHLGKALQKISIFSDDDSDFYTPAQYSLTSHST